MILLFILSLFAECDVKIDMATLGKNFSSEIRINKVFFTEGSYQIDEQYYTQAVIDYEVDWDMEVDKVTVKSTIHFNNNVIKICNKKIVVVYIEDLEDILQCVCKYSKSYYVLEDVWSSYIKAFENGIVYRGR